jgi:hypothetical protein
MGEGGNMGKRREKEKRKMTEEKVNIQQNSFNNRRHQHCEKIKVLCHPRHV